MELELAFAEEAEIVDVVNELGAADDVDAGLLELEETFVVEETTVEEREEAAAGLYMYISSFEPPPQYSEELPEQSIEHPVVVSADPALRVFPQ